MRWNTHGADAAVVEIWERVLVELYVDDYGCEGAGEGEERGEEDGGAHCAGAVPEKVRKREERGWRCVYGSLGPVGVLMG